MPFVPAQQRYDALKKYAARVEAVKQEIVRIGSPTTTAPTRLIQYINYVHWVYWQIHSWQLKIQALRMN